MAVGVPGVTVGCGTKCHIISIHRAVPPRYVHFPQIVKYSSSVLNIVTVFSKWACKLAGIRAGQPPRRVSTRAMGCFPLGIFTLFTSRQSRATRRLSTWPALNLICMCPCSPSTVFIPANKKKQLQTWLLFERPSEWKQKQYLESSCIHHWGRWWRV